MKRRKRTGAILGLALMAGAVLCAGCGRNIIPNNDVADPISATSEGEDTICEITGYTRYAGDDPSLFLEEGDTIAVIAPSSLPTRKQMDATLEGLKKWGYNPVEGEYACVKERTREQCLQDLQWALTDPSVKAVFCVRGGYGGSQIMDEMPLDLVETSEKLIIGYSDITAFHSAWTMAGLPSVHGSMSAAFTDLPEACVKAQQQMLKGMIPAYRCEGSGYDRPGEAEGILLGGNLSTYLAVLNTDYDSSMISQPYILFFEDVNEDLEHIHRYLTILKHNGVLENAEGILFGEWTEIPSDCGFQGQDRGGEFASAADMICREILDDMDLPVAFGFPAGHGDTSYPLLMGEPVKLAITEDSYTLEWK